MATREEDERIKELKKMGIYPYSISKLNAIDGCLREAYYTYKCHDRGKQNIYGIMGSRIHDALEHIYNGEAGQESLLPALNEELADADLVGVDFPKDFRGGDAIRNSWVSDMTDFCNSFQKMNGEFVTEQLIIYKVSDTRYLIGYADLIQIVDAENKIIDIYDFKTSSRFKASDLQHHGRQLIVYGMAKEQEGYTIRNLAWIMLKYVKVTFDGYSRSNAKSKTKIEKIIQRSKLYKELAPHIERQLYELGYSDIDNDLYMNTFRETGKLDGMPSEVINNFNIEQYIEYYDFNLENKLEAFNYINDKADMFETLWSLNKDEWKPVEINDKQSFYCNNLCSHRFICEALQEYKRNYDLNVEDEDLF